MRFDGENVRERERSGGADAPAHPARPDPLPGAEPGAALAEVERAFLVAGASFGRWAEGGFRAVGVEGIRSGDIMMLRLVARQEHGLRTADAALTLALTDTGATQAAGRLEKAGLVLSRGRGRNRRLGLSPRGAAALDRHRLLCAALLAPAIPRGAEELTAAASLLRLLSGQFDQAARAAAAMT